MSTGVDRTSRKAFSGTLGGLSRNCWQGWCQLRQLAATNSRLSVLNRNTEELPERRRSSTGLFPHLMSARRWSRPPPPPALSFVLSPRYALTYTHTILLSARRSLVSNSSSA